MQNDRFQFQTLENTRKMAPGKKAKNNNTKKNGTPKLPSSGSTLQPEDNGAISAAAVKKMIMVTWYPP